MREFDDNAHSYGPVLRRVGILATVVIAVPVMLWTITSFMRTYVAQPVIASPKPLLAPLTTASIGTPKSATPAAGKSDNAPVQTASIAPTNTATDSNPPSPTAKVAALATSDMPPSMSAQPASDASAAGSPWPDPSQSIGGQPMGTRQVSSPRVPPPADNSDDALPSTAPLTGPIPLPPRRPAVIAMTTPGAVPLPRTRPASAGSSTEPTSDGAGNILTHLFGQTH